MKFALISDIHGNLPALEAVFFDCKQNDVSSIYNLGDSLNGPLWPEETRNFITKNNISSIRGNGDEDIINLSAISESLKYTRNNITDTTLAWVSNLPFSFSNDDITIFHGTPNSNNEYLLEDISLGFPKNRSLQDINNNLEGIKTKYIGCGHSHLENIFFTNSNKVIINAGSVGLPAYFDNNPFHKMETFNPYSKYVLIDNDVDNVSIKYINYDFQSSANQALRNNRTDWYHWLIHGTI